ncbi:heterokaryon incompatibility protein-domain-containing protein, partial [Fusarium oxysporum f. sp. albedinis]
FAYMPFDLERPGFRLVPFQGGSQFPLECRIFQAYLDDQENIIPYEALSYAWGEQNTPEEVVMGGKPMFVTTSLHEALCYMRQPHEDRILWADAICIDQSDVNERDQQVRHMVEIYGKADNL